ncbi:unnamed protein product [Hymenolepis diminuta]|uniref:Protein kinase domain-containing protein n=1 Tax=Hymenolepis diminuta TaxID=6216 RepID=A0A564Y9C1_HYMDI|nr:unnamed protein product [Hymenolepis diminuta]
MDTKPFEPEKFLGNGCLGFVYSVISQHQHDRNKLYALKRFSMERPTALIYALKEYNALKKLSLDSDPSPFVPKLFYAFTIDVSPVLVLNQASGITLYDIIDIHGPLKIQHARFYLSEVMCGLKYLHYRNIVHMECKPDNILISQLGHVILSDFDRSYDLSNKIPNDHDFLVAHYYAAPEIACKMMITPQADVWTLGVLMTDLIGKKIRSGGDKGKSVLSKAMGGTWNIKRFSRLIMFYGQISRKSKNSPFSRTLIGKMLSRFTVQQMGTSALCLATSRHCTPTFSGKRGRARTPSSSLKEFVPAMLGLSNPSPLVQKGECNLSIAVVHPP